MNIQEGQLALIGQKKWIKVENKGRIATRSRKIFPYINLFNTGLLTYMPTIAQIAAAGEVTAIHLGILFHREIPERRLYGTPGFLDWYVNELPKLDIDFKEDIKPTEQVLARLRQFILGRPHLRTPQQLNSIRHVSEIIWELKTPHVRIFGAFPQIDTFIAHCGGDADVIKANYLYTPMAEQAAAACQALGSGQLKFINSKERHHVISS